MKKRYKWLLLYGVYGILLAALLVLQWMTIREDMLRLLANILAFLLACPVVLLVFVRRTELEKTIFQKHADREEERDSGEHIEDELSDSKADTKIRTMEDFCEWAKQWNFSAREQEVGWLIYKGYTNRQIARELCIAETTVKKHAGHIYEKAGVSGRKDFSALIRCREINKEEDGYDSIRDE